MILHIPHASTVIPKEYRSLINLTDEELAAEHRYMCDMYTDELFDYRCEKVIASISRLICDMERFENDDDEEMAKIGMGVCYTHDHNLQQFKTVTPEHRVEIIKKYYKPHHKKLERLVDEDIKKYGYGVIIDCHSFSSTMLPYETNDARPEICIGFNRKEERDTEIANYIYNRLKERFDVKINEPFSGAMTPIKYINKDIVIPIMIEIRRDLYMNERTGKKNENFKEIKKFLFNLLKEIETVQKENTHIALNKSIDEIHHNVDSLMSNIIKDKLNKIKKQVVLEATIDWISSFNEQTKCMCNICQAEAACISWLLFDAFERKNISKEEAFNYFVNDMCYGTNKPKENAIEMFEYIIKSFIATKNMESNRDKVLKALRGIVIKKLKRKEEKDKYSNLEEEKEYYKKYIASKFEKETK